MNTLSARKLETLFESLKFFIRVFVSYVNVIKLALFARF
jgi:hypothetical protein